MTASSASHGSGSQKLSPPSVKWRHWPLRDEWRIHLPVAIFSALAVFAVGVATRESWAVVGTIVIVLAVLWRWWAPIEYDVGSKGITQTILGRTHLTPWRNVRRYELGPHGAMLFPMADAAPLDAWRGLFVPFGSHRESITENLAFYVSQNRDSSSDLKRVLTERGSQSGA